MVTWEVVPRDANLGRTHDPVSRWTDLTVIERHNKPDSWTITGPSSALSMFTPGMGAILDRDGEQVTSGQVVSIRRSETAEDGRSVDTTTLGFTSDLAALGARTVLPAPSYVVGTAPGALPAAYDVRTGPAEDLIVAYVNANLGGLDTASISDRRLTGLLLPTSLGRGGTTTVSARFSNLGEVMHDLGESGGLRVRLQHDESTGTPRLAMVIDTVPDVSDDVRFGPADSLATGLLTSWEYQLDAPTVTRAFVLGGGQGIARQVLQVREPDAEALWGGVWEQTVDQRQTEDADEMTRAGTSALEEGAGAVTVAFTVADGPDVQYRRDYGVGYRVGLDLPGMPDALADNVVREVTTRVTSDAPHEELTVVVGTPDSSAQQTHSARRVAQALRRVASLERRA